MDMNINQVQNNPPENINEVNDINNAQNNFGNTNLVEPLPSTNANPSNTEERRNDNIPGNNAEINLPFKIEEDHPSSSNVELNENRSQSPIQPNINTQNNLLSNVIDSNKAIPEPSQEVPGNNQGNMNNSNPLGENNISQPLVGILEHAQNNVQIAPNETQPNPNTNNFNFENNSNHLSDHSGNKPINPEPLQGNLNQILSGQIDINNNNSNPQQNSPATEPNSNQQINQEEEEKIEFASQIQSFNNNENQNQNPTLSQIIKNE